MSKRQLIQSLIFAGKSSTEIQSETGIPISTIRYHRETRRHDGTVASRIAEHRRKLKRKAIDYSGGKCLKCGYCACESALTFHHLDPTQKESRLSSGSTKSWLKFKRELDKTIIVCHNCHSEHHTGLWIPDGVMIQLQLEIRLAYIDKPLLDYADIPR